MSGTVSPAPAATAIPAATAAPAAAAPTKSAASEIRSIGRPRRFMRSLLLGFHVRADAFGFRVVRESFRQRGERREAGEVPEPEPLVADELGIDPILGEPGLD